MKAKYATQIRRGILLALIGVNLKYAIEEPSTINAYMRTFANNQEQR